MKKRFGRKKFGGPLPWRYVFLLTGACFVFLTTIGIWTVNSKIQPTLMHFAESETKRIATLVINDAIKKQVSEQDWNNLLSSSQIASSSASNLQFDTRKINQLLSSITASIQSNLEHVEEGELQKIEQLSGTPLHKSDSKGIVYEVPLGLATKNVFLAHLGPNIPIEFSVIGDVETDVQPTVTPYGVNNAFVKVNVQAKVNVSIIAPFSTKTTTVVTNVPIVMSMIQGDVPGFYNGIMPNLNQNQNQQKIN